jgi:hypothetical protein
MRATPPAHQTQTQIPTGIIKEIEKQDEIAATTTTMIMTMAVNLTVRAILMVEMEFRHLITEDLDAGQVLMHTKGCLKQDSRREEEV